MTRFLYMVPLGFGMLLLAAGLWLSQYRTPESGISEDIPEVNHFARMYESMREIGDNVIFVKLDRAGRGQFYRLAISRDGNMLVIHKSVAILPHRMIRKGKITQEELRGLIEFFKQSGFEKLEPFYGYKEDLPSGAIRVGDMALEISINCEEMVKTVKAGGFRVFYEDDQPPPLSAFPEYVPDCLRASYPAMPYPLNEIYARLNELVIEKTEVTEIVEHYLHR